MIQARGQRGSKMIFGRVGVTTTRDAAVLSQRSNKRQRAINLRRERHFRDEPAEAQIYSPFALERRTNLFWILRARFFFRNEWSFDVNADDACTAKRFIAQWLCCCEHAQNLCFRRCHCCERDGRGAASQMKFGEHAKRYRARLHRVAARPAVNVQIDKARRKKSTA